MTAQVLFVSVNQSFDPSFSLPELESWVERAWCLTVAKAAACDRVVAVRSGAPLAAWRLRGAFPTDETYEVGGATRPRVGLSLGDPLPILDAYASVPALRHGVATADCAVDPLPVERRGSPLDVALTRYCQDAANLSRKGSMLGLAMADLAGVAGPAQGSPLHVLEIQRKMIPGGDWPQSNVVNLREALLGFTAAAAYQLDGVASLLAGGPPVHLHPLVTLVRGIAEACGQSWWLIEPWLDDGNVGALREQGEWEKLSRPILPRIELAWLELLATRRRRCEEAYGLASSEYQKWDKALESYRSELTSHHTPAEVRLSGGRVHWEISGEKLLTKTEMVKAATEYAVGQHTRGTGPNLYPLFSGYAHASLEIIITGLFDGSETRRPFSDLHAADPSELRKLTALATRTFAAGYEIVAAAFGSDLADLRAWEHTVDLLTIA